VNEKDQPAKKYERQATDLHVRSDRVLADHERYAN
jgi:hypothetical protein